jgi:hypothetical protein
MKIKNLPICLLMLLSWMNYSCNNLSSSQSENKISSNFHMDKKYWDPEDYEAARSELYTYMDGKKYPNLSDPNTAMVFNKIADITNVSIVVEDSTLGITHRSKFAEEMFDKYKSFYEFYDKSDREDKFIYPSEIVEIVLFGVYTQIHYFKLGNENILKEAIDPNSDKTKYVLNSNASTIVSNMKFSLDFCKKEDALTPEAIHTLAVGLDKYLPLLFKTFPDTDYSELKSQIEILLSTVKSDELKQMLSKMNEEIDNIKNT